MSENKNTDTGEGAAVSVDSAANPRGETPLSDFARKGWFSDHSTSKFRLRVYTSLGISTKRFVEVLQINGASDIDVGPHVQISFVTLQGMKISVVSSFMYSNSAGTTQIENSVGSRELPHSNYVFLSTPSRVDGEDLPAVDIDRRLTIAAAIVRVHFGVNFLRDKIYDVDVSADSSQVSFGGPAIKVPKAAEGPFIANRNFEQVGEIFRKLEDLRSENRERIVLALEFFNQALDDEHAFFHYWIALEILCNGGAPAIRQCLKECYELKSVNDVRERTGFDAIADMRHDFFHKGTRPVLTADVERYIQLLFLDLLRFKIHLPLVGHLNALQLAKGYDLTPVGLSPEQIEDSK